VGLANPTLVIERALAPYVMATSSVA